MRVALFGGTFNPPHLGHLLMAEAARVQFRLDRVIFLPTSHPPHKSVASFSAPHRLAMTRLAVRGHPCFQVSDWEIRQARTVYTYETVAYFRKRWPRAALFFIIGSDSLSHLHAWRHGPALLKEARFLVVERPEAPWRKIPALLRTRVTPVHAPQVTLASHDIRHAVRRGRSIRYQVPASVAAYIQKHRLYS